MKKEDIYKKVDSSESPLDDILSELATKKRIEKAEEILVYFLDEYNGRDPSQSMIEFLIEQYFETYG